MKLTKYAFWQKILFNHANNKIFQEKFIFKGEYLNYNTIQKSYVK